MMPRSSIINKFEDERAPLKINFFMVSLLICYPIQKQPYKAQLARKHVDYIIIEEYHETLIHSIWSVGFDPAMHLC
jgi:hypothetical protein